MTNIVSTNDIQNMFIDFPLAPNTVQVNGNEVAWKYSHDQIISIYY